MSEARMLPVQDPLTAEEEAYLEAAHTRLCKLFSMKQDEKDELFNSGIFNDIATGYGKLALELLGKDSKFLKEFETAMNTAFDFYDADDARKAYQRIEG